MTHRPLLIKMTYRHHHISNIINLVMTVISVTESSRRRRATYRTRPPPVSRK